MGEIQGEEGKIVDGSAERPHLTMRASLLMAGDDLLAA